MISIITAIIINLLLILLKSFLKDIYQLEIKFDKLFNILSNHKYIRNNQEINELIRKTILKKIFNIQEDSFFFNLKELIVKINNICYYQNTNNTFIINFIEKNNNDYPGCSSLDKFFDNFNFTFLIKINYSTAPFENGPLYYTFNIRIYLKIPTIFKSAIKKHEKIKDSIEHFLNEKQIFYHYDSDYEFLFKLFPQIDNRNRFLQ